MGFKLICRVLGFTLLELQIWNLGFRLRPKGEIVQTAVYTCAGSKRRYDSVCCWLASRGPSTRELRMRRGFCSSHTSEPQKRSVLGDAPHRVQCLRSVGIRPPDNLNSPRNWANGGTLMSYALQLSAARAPLCDLQI